MTLFKPYIPKEERDETNRKLPGLMVEGLFLGGTGLGVLALIFEIAADAFSVAAYQTLLAINGAEGYHDIAIVAFTVLSVMLLFGVVPAYKAAAYLRPDTGGSGPLVESAGPDWLRWASWVGTSLFFLDAILTIIISSISAADVTLLLLPELASFRIVMAEVYAFFIMAWLIALGPKRAVPIFLLGGSAFTIFTIFALSYVAVLATTQPELGAGTMAIVERLEAAGVVEHVTQSGGAITQVVFFQLLLRSMSSAMLGFSGYEMIPASGKHAARPKWKVINTALTIAAIFLIGTGLIQLYAAQVWAIPATEGYSTLLIEYELVFGTSATLTVAGILLALILLLAQGGGYVGGAAVAAIAARLGRLPSFFTEDRIGIAVIWLMAAIFIPVIRSVVIVEAYYAFGFVSAFLITGMTVTYVRDDVLESAGIEPGSGEARSLKFAGLRGLIASSIMMIILITQKTEALPVIVGFAAVLTLLQWFMAHGGLRKRQEKEEEFDYTPGSEDRTHRYATGRIHYHSGVQRSHDEARQRGLAYLVNEMIEEGEFVKFNVEEGRIRRLVSYRYCIEDYIWEEAHEHAGHYRLPEPSRELEATFQKFFSRKEEMANTIENYSHLGIFTFIDNYHVNWVSTKRSPEDVQRAMLKALFRLSDQDIVWEEYKSHTKKRQPEPVWQFSRERYLWAKDQWPNLSDRVTTIWTLQDLDIINEENTDTILRKLGAAY